jgi:tetratricopeptide (TPR) repeat protein
MKTKRNPLYCRILLTVALLAWFAFIAVGCESIGHLRQAQDAFNDAARNELQMTYDAPSAGEGTDQFTDSVRKYNEAKTLYAAALAHLDMISRKEEASLKKNRLYGTVLTLKALCYWKLKEYEKALEVKKEAAKLDDRHLVPRDRQIFQLLTALIAIDETLPIVKGMSGKDETIKEKNFIRVKKILISNEEKKCAAVCTIDSVLNDPTLDKAMRMYAQKVKLMALKRYFEAYAVLTGGKCPPKDDKQWEEARKTLGQLQKTAGGSADAVARKIVESWIDKIGCKIKVTTE